jgi:hypothetical protein
MRTISIIFVALLLSTLGAHADSTWCAQYSMQGGGTNCGFYSFEQCQLRVGHWRVLHAQSVLGLCRGAAKAIKAVIY